MLNSTHTKFTFREFDLLPFAGKIRVINDIKPGKARQALIKHVFKAKTTVKTH